MAQPSSKPSSTATSTSTSTSTSSSPARLGKRARATSSGRAASHVTRQISMVDRESDDSDDNSDSEDAGNHASTTPTSRRNTGSSSTTTSSSSSKMTTSSSSSSMVSVASSSTDDSTSTTTLALDQPPILGCGNPECSNAPYLLCPHQIIEGPWKECLEAVERATPWPGNTIIVPFATYTTDESLHYHYSDCVKWFGRLVLSKGINWGIALWSPRSYEGTRITRKRVRLVVTRVPSTIIEPTDALVQDAHVKIHTFQFDHNTLWFTKFAVSPSLQLLAVGNDLGRVFLWYLDWDSLFRDPYSFDTDDGTIRSLTFSNDSKYANTSSLRRESRFSDGLLTRT